MEFLLALGTINSFFFGLIVFSRHSRTKADNLLTTLFIVLGLSFGTIFLSYILNLPGLQILMWNISLLIAPLLYLYGYSLINCHVDLRLKIFINLIPYFASLLYLAVVPFIYSDSEIRLLFSTDLKNADVFFLFFTVIETLAIPFYIILIFRWLKKHNKNIRLFFSNLTDQNLKWLRVLIIGILFMWLIINVLYYLSPLNDEISPKFGFGAASVLIFYLGYFATKQKPIYNSDSEIPADNKKYYKSEMKSAEIEVLYTRLHEVMEHEKPYLDPDISLNNLAVALDISSHKLSQLINTKFEMSFFDLINKYRIDEFEKRVRKDDIEKYTLISIAYECGFNSKSSFNRVFKNVTGQTPTNFVKNLPDT